MQDKLKSKESITESFDDDLMRQMDVHIKLFQPTHVSLKRVKIRFSYTKQFRYF